MELTKSQISELFSTFLSSGDCFNTLVESLLDAVESTGKKKINYSFEELRFQFFKAEFLSQSVI